jgi:hypothetical protein
MTGGRDFNQVSAKILFSRRQIILQKSCVKIRQENKLNACFGAFPFLLRPIDSLDDESIERVFHKRSLPFFGFRFWRRRKDGDAGS